MDKLKIVLDLVRKGAITDEQAEALLCTEKVYVYQPYYQPYIHSWPWTYSSPTVTFTSGYMTTTTCGDSDSVSCCNTENTSCGCGDECKTAAV